MLAGLAIVLVAAVLLVVGWWDISGTAVVAKQLPYLASATIPGAALLITGAVVSLSALGRGDRRVDALYELLTEPLPNAPGTPGTTIEELVTVEGTGRYHRPSCVLVVGKLTRGLDRTEVAAGTLTACPVCLAGQ